jgi:MOSC domain-containing protein YiiM
MTAVDEAALEAGRGLVGDRYHRGNGTFSEDLKGQPDSEITLIESEEIERFNRDHGQSLGYGEARRNLVTSGVRLNDLVGRRFKVGGAELEGVRLCEPCAHLARTVNPRVLPGLVHRAGLRARIVEGAAVRPGDGVAALPEA